ncbi:MAG: M48 family metalloprotease [Aquabacterium sp.]|uniref:M48 family metalloprotease n=1 Tax=Aquabacterium sp. TaxID=1872578 RepID=UPI0025B8F0EE|nr:M48 family metalloprotease [Aquabacterium sp.]MBI5926003.1 M48 family metalloprotease [Aquabacterium sp.]
MPLTVSQPAHSKPPLGARAPSSPRRKLARWGLAAVITLGWPLALSVQAQNLPPSGSASSSLPALGDAAAQELSPMAERRLGDRIMRSILRDPDVLDDPMVLEYVSQVWGRLLTGARQRGEISPELEASHAWEPFLVRDRTVNAFALPGGYIGVHLGLLAMTTTPDELASVLAHELSHVTQRHIARMIGQQSRQSWVSLASMVLGILAASRNPQAAQAMIYGGQAVAIQGQLNFSRDMEREADRVGYGVLGESGFDQAGMAEMFEHLQQASRLNDDGSYPYLRTHPLTTERIGEARARLGPGGWRLAAQASGKDSAIWAQHALMAARARVLMDTRSVSLQNLSNPDIKRNATALQAVTAYYMAGVAQQRGGDAAHGLQTLALARQAARSLPGNQQATVQRILTLAVVECQLAGHLPLEAALTLNKDLAENKAASHEDGRPEALLAARIALALPPGKAQPSTGAEAAARLQTHVSDHPHDAAAWSSLAELWQRLKEPLRAVRAEAEAVAALGDLPGAIDRIQGAQKRFRQPNAADVIELSVMDARLKVWQRQQREDLRDEAGR